MGLYSGGRIIGRIMRLWFALGYYFQEGLLSELYGLLSSRERSNKSCKDAQVSNAIVSIPTHNKPCDYFRFLNYWNMTLITSSISFHFPFLWSHFRWALPVGYFHVPLTCFSIHFCACLIHFCGSSHVCAVRFIFFARFDWYWCSWIYLYAFRFICMQFNSFLWGSIHLCAVRFIFVPVRFNFCSVRSIFWTVRFIFAWFDSFFAVLIFYDRFSFYLCAFHIVHFGLEDFVRNRAP